MSDSPTAAAVRGESAPAIISTGTSTPSIQNAAGGAHRGGASITACPFAPPMPELVIAIKDRPLEERQRRGSGSTGTRRRYCAHLIAGLGVLRFAVGGMSPVSKMPGTTTDTRMLKGATSAESVSPYARGAQP